MKIAYNKFFIYITALFFSFAILSCGGSGGTQGVSDPAQPSSAGKTLYTQTNIWYEKPMKILPIFHKGAIIPAGTKVRINETNSKVILFSNSKGTQYRIYTQKYYNMSGDEMVALLFGAKNPMAKGGKFHKYTKAEQQSIKRGKITKGMRREAVIMAYGYPPTHVNPSIEADSWQVWKSRWDRMIVYFKNGKVSRIKD